MSRPAIICLLALVMLAWPRPLTAGPPERLTVLAANPQLAEHVRQIVQESGPRLQAWLGVSPAALRVEVAASRADFDRRAGQLGAPLWAAGLALPREGLILLRSPSQLTEPGDFRFLLIHELTHLYLGLALRQRPAPTWLEEGLAMYAAGEGGWRLAAVMSQGVLGDHLLPLGQLARSFPDDPGKAALAYAQSYYLVSFLLDQHGQQVLADLVAALAQGQELSPALRRVTGQGLYQLQQAFFQRVRSRFSWLLVATAAGTLWALVALAAAVGLVLRRRGQRARMRAAGPVRGPAELPEPGPRHWPPPPKRGNVLQEAGLEGRQEPPS